MMSPDQPGTSTATGGGLREWWRVSDGGFIWLAATLAFVISILVFAPRYYLWEFAADLRNVAEVSRAIYTRQQLVEPWAQITQPAHRVQEWRLFFPYLVYLLHLPRVVYYALPFIGALCSTALAIAIVLERTRSRMLAAVVGGLMTTSSWFFVSVGFLAYFDSWLIFCLLLAVFRAGPWSLFGVVALGMFIDERAILAAPMIWGLRQSGFGPESRNSKDDAVALVLAALPYAAFRGGYTLAYGDSSVGDYFSFLYRYRGGWGQVLSGIWNGLRMAWLPIVGLLLSSRVPARRLLALSAVVTLGAALLSAGDYSRSTSVLAPMAVAGMISLRPGTPMFVSLLALGSLALNLVLPAEHVFAIGSTDLRPIAAIQAEAKAFDESRRDDPLSRIRLNILSP